MLVVLLWLLIPLVFIFLATSHKNILRGMTLCFVCPSTLQIEHTRPLSLHVASTQMKFNFSPSCICPFGHSKYRNLLSFIISSIRLVISRNKIKISLFFSYFLLSFFPSFLPTNSYPQFQSARAINYPFILV